MGLLISLDKGNYVILATDNGGNVRRWSADTIEHAQSIVDRLVSIGGNMLEVFGADGLRFWAVGG
jgi:hypothetical protein